MTKHLLPLLIAMALFASSALAADVEYSTTGAMDTPATMGGDFGRTAVIKFKGTFGASAVEDRTPRAVALLGNYPNPFNPSTTITFSLPRDMAVDLVVYSLEGRPVRRLLQGSRVAGTHQVVWDGTDRQNRAVPSGIYLVRMVTEDGVDARKVVLAK